MKNYSLFIITIVFLLFLNLLFNIIIFKHVKFSNVFFYLLESLMVSSLLFLIIQLFSLPFKKAFLIVFVLLLIIFYLMQIIYYSVSGSFCSMFSIVHGLQIFYYMSTVIRSFFRNIVDKIHTF